MKEMNLFFLWGENDQILEVKKAKCWWEWTLTGWGNLEFSSVPGGAPNIWSHMAGLCKLCLYLRAAWAFCTRGCWFWSKLAVPYGSCPLFPLKLPCSNTSQKTPARAPPASKNLGRKLKKRCRLNGNFQSSVALCHETQPQALRCHRQWDDAHWLNEK